MAEHAPGPWEAQIQSPQVIIVKTIYGNPYMDESELIICDITPGKKAEGNAHLIAAAPDLHHAAAVALGDLVAQGLEGTSTGKLLHDALAKARGTTEGGTDG